MIAVIGGSGFVGTRLCERLASEDAKFIIIDKNQSSRFPNLWSKADVRDIDSLRKVVPEGATIINLAAEHRDDVRPASLYHDVNVDGASNICKIASEKGVNKIIFTSSVACYGFAQPGTDESGVINPFNEYGRTKFKAEEIFQAWFDKERNERSLIIVRPTVIFGEANRGNVYNLLRQIAAGHFLMIGNGKNKKSMAYVENVAAFLQYALVHLAGRHIFNYVDKPDFDMRTLVSVVKNTLGRKDRFSLSVPYGVGYACGVAVDVLARVTKKSYPISAIRVKKFCSTTQFNTSIEGTDFQPPVELTQGLIRTIKYEFLDDNKDKPIYITE